MLKTSRRFLMYFFFNDTPTTEIFSLPLHDALPICLAISGPVPTACPVGHGMPYLRDSELPQTIGTDRKSTRLNSSHANISHAVFCLKKNMMFSILPRGPQGFIQGF